MTEIPFKVKLTVFQNIFKSKLGEIIIFTFSSRPSISHIGIAEDATKLITHKHTKICLINAIFRLNCLFIYIFLQKTIKNCSHFTENLLKKTWIVVNFNV